MGKKDGAIVKRCRKCRDKDDLQKKKPENRAKANARQNERQYYKTWRAKQLAQDPVAFRRHNADVQKAWRDNNPVHVTAWRTNNVNYRLKGIKQQAGEKGYRWNSAMTKAVCTTMMTSPCFYCEFLSIKTKNGIDRMDNFRGYMVDNCVPCCKACNFSKKCLDAHTFVRRCIHISAVHGAAAAAGETSHASAWPDSMPRPLRDYKTRAEKKELAFEITEAEYAQLCATPCHYCARAVTEGNRSSMDRVDNDKGYTTANVVPCCWECNGMRTLTPRDEFIAMCKRVAARAHTLVIPPMPTCIRVITKRRPADDDEEEEENGVAEGGAEEDLVVEMLEAVEDGEETEYDEDEECQEDDE